MNQPPAPLPTSLENLLIHADWVRALARSLVRDPATADDVAQEVWRAALERPPAHDSNPRGWLASVARNAARALKRGDRRRDDRERKSARSEALPSTARLVEEASLSRELAAVVIQLDEPYRTTLLLRWYREMDADAIAKAQGLSRETVRTRLRRGLEMLREKLDASHGGREAWLTAFAPLVRVEITPAVAAASAIGATWMWTLAAASIVAITWFAWPADAGDADKIASYSTDKYGNAYAVHESGKTEPWSPKMDVEPRETSRSVVTPQKTAASSSPVATRTIEARVVDAEKHAIAGFAVDWRMIDEPHWEGDTLHTRAVAIEFPKGLRERMREPHPEDAMDPAEWNDQPFVWEMLTRGEVGRVHAISDANGRIHAEVPVEGYERVVTEPRRVIVAVIESESNAIETWVVAPTVKLAGIVVDESGAPIASVGLSVGPVWDFVELFRDIDPKSIRMAGSAMAQTDANGKFEFEQAVYGLHSAIELFVHGKEPQVVTTPDHDDLSMRIVVKDKAPTQSPHVSGIVVDSAGNPVSGAWVQLGQDAASSDATGRFDIEVSNCSDGTPLTAVVKGQQAAIQLDFGRARMKSVENVVLRMGGPTLSITGRVLDVDGSPIAACNLRLVDGTQAGTSDRMIEDLSANETQARRVTSADGTFDLGGLSDREYTLLAWHDERGYIARLEHVAAGSKDVVLHRAASDFIASVSGRLVDSSGEAVEGAKIGIALPIVLGPNWVTHRISGETRSAAGGAFTLHDVPREGMKLWVRGEGLDEGTLAMPDLRAAPITVVVAIKVRAQLSVSDPSIERVRFEDREGAVVDIDVFHLRTISTSDFVARENGSFPNFDVSDQAVTAVLMHGDGTIARRAPISVRRAKLLALDL